MSNNISIKLSKRLLKIAELVKIGGTVSDIGTDHAYLPIYLINNNIANYVYASDINEGPVECAKRHVLANGLSNKIEVFLAAGLDKIENCRSDTVIIAGMGGELIRDIISASDYFKNNKDAELVLQPMTHQADLRKWLCANGYSITNEELVFEDRRIYQIICAYYSGVAEEISEAEAYLGKINIKKNTKELAIHIKRILTVLDTTINGKISAGKNIETEENIKNEILSRWSDLL